jgi:hypothetical protein
MSRLAGKKLSSPRAQRLICQERLRLNTIAGPIGFELDYGKLKRERIQLGKGICSSANQSKSGTVY